MKMRKERLVANIASGLCQVTRDEIIVRSIASFRSADVDFGARLEKTVAERRS